MTTLQQIGFTLAGGTAVLVVSFGLFGFAVTQQSSYIAPRATARPGTVIYNPHPVSSSQQRGNPVTGWIPWTLALSYDTMMNGVPGTGTREQGLSGSLLRVNLDGIVLLRFHAVCLRVCGTAAALFCILGVPIYLSAQCYTFGQEGSSSGGCANKEYNLTNYERTTMANVPSITHTSPTQTVVHPQDGILWRLYAIVFCFWMVAGHLCHLLHAEWVQVLAMRRVYYLEYDIWGKRREELKQTLMYQEIAEQKREILQNQQTEHAKQITAEDTKRHFTFDKQKKIDQVAPSKAAAAAAAAAAATAASADPEEHLTKRPPWIPHPEQRDTVPNVALYSILVGGLPSLPEQAADSFNADSTIQFSKRESIDWQLSLTTTFFDHCVPNQPGFSSSVAAVTIIPGAMDLSVAWRKWYAAAGKLRRLRFLRKEIAKRRDYAIIVPSSSDDKFEDIAKYGYGDDNEEVYVPADASDEDVSSYLADLPPRTPAPDNQWDMPDETPRGIYDDHLQNREYYRQVLGSALGGETDTHIYDALEFGPEQAAVYAREFAQSAAPCCPNGCNERRIRNAPIDQLVEMERILAVEVHQANMELRQARQRATRTNSNYANNLHDQQQGQQPQVAVTSAASPHSCFGGATTTTPTFLPPKVVDEEGGEDAEVADAVVPLRQHQPMASRYDRRGSANADDSKLTGRLKTNRLDPDRLGDMVVPGDLDLEAQLYKKSTGEIPRNTISKPMNKSPPRIGTTPKPSDRKTPNLEGLNLPSGISLEAQLTHDASFGSTGSHHRRPASGRLSDIPEKAALRQREASSDAEMLLDKQENEYSSSAQWAQVETIITEARNSERSSGTKSSARTVATGQWEWPNLKWFFTRTKENSKNLQKWAAKQSKEAVEKIIARESTFAVVTFTSRQAAVAARSCLADGRGAGRWMTLKDLPIPPLADAAPGDICTFRNCCRPVTLSKWLNRTCILIAYARFADTDAASILMSDYIFSHLAGINERQKNCRNYLYVCFHCVGMPLLVFARNLSHDV
jgi:Late exocytosis, associated with Golgi transport